MFEKRIIVKAVYYRYFDGEDKTESKYYIQIAKDEHNNPYDIELTYEQFKKLQDDGAINCVVTSRTEMPQLHKDMPAYCYHNISVHMYEFNRTFNAL